MSLLAAGVIGIGIFVVLLFLAQNVGLAMLVSGFIGIILVRGWDAALSTLGFTVYRTASSGFLVVLPLFILMGMATTQAGVAKELFDALNKWVGHFRGGLAMAATCACTIFGSLCGNVVATSATLGKVALPEMRRYGYDDMLSAGTIASGGNLGALVPPSTAFIVFGFVTQTPIGQLFAAGIIPAIVLTILLCVQIYIQVRVKPSLAPQSPHFTWHDRLVSLKGFIAAILVFGVTMGGIMTGIFTPTEAGAVGVVLMFLVGVVTRRLTWKGFYTAIRSAGHISGMIFLLIMGAMVFSSFLTVTEITMRFTDAIMSWGLNRYLIMLIVLFFYFIMGTFMDSWAMLIITLPVFMPVIAGLGFDPLHFGVLCAITVAIGNISPPVGVTVYALRGVAPDISLTRVFRGCIPFMVTMTLFMIAMIWLPKLATWLPSLMLAAK
jgi:tripartite ATP-independent transporter DctM subunit